MPSAVLPNLVSQEVDPQHQVPSAVLAVARRHSRMDLGVRQVPSAVLPDAQIPILLGDLATLTSCL